MGSQLSKLRACISPSEQTGRLALMPPEILRPILDLAAFADLSADTYYTRGQAVAAAQARLGAVCSAFRAIIGDQGLYLSIWSPSSSILALQYYRQERRRAGLVRFLHISGEWGYSGVEVDAGWFEEMLKALPQIDSLEILADVAPVDRVTPALISALRHAHLRHVALIPVYEVYTRETWRERIRYVDTREVPWSVIELVAMSWYQLESLELLTPGLSGNLGPIRRPAAAPPIKLSITSMHWRAESGLHPDALLHLFTSFRVKHYSLVSPHADSFGQSVFGNFSPFLSDLELYDSSLGDLATILRVCPNLQIVRRGLYPTAPLEADFVALRLGHRLRIAHWPQMPNNEFLYKHLDAGSFVAGLTLRFDLLPGWKLNAPGEARCVAAFAARNVKLQFLPGHRLV